MGNLFLRAQSKRFCVEIRTKIPANNLIGYMKQSQKGRFARTVLAHQDGQRSDSDVLRLRKSNERPPVRNARSLRPTTLMCGFILPSILT